MGGGASAFTISIAIVSAAALAAVLWLAMRVMERRALFTALKLRLLLIKIPQESSDAGGRDKPKDFKTEINLTEQLLTVLSDLKTAFALEVAVHHSGDEIHFYLAVPEGSLDFATRAVHGLWPAASIEPSQDYTIFNPEGESQAAYIKLRSSYLIPLRTYQEIESDTFQAILSNLSKLEKVGEGAALQLVVKHAPHAAQKNIEDAIRKLKKGKRLEEAIGSNMLVEAGKAIAEHTRAEKKDGEKEPVIIDEDAVKFLEQKIAKPLFAVNVRVITSAHSKESARRLLDNIVKALGQFEAPRRNRFRVVVPSLQRKLIFQYTFRQFIPAQTMYLTSEELAGAFHFPGATTNVPRIKWLKTKEAAPPGNLPEEGVIIGNSVYRGERRDVRIATEDRRRHLYVVGQTGTGKSNLITYMASQDIAAGRGLAIIDPHGDLIADTLALVPPERADDVVIFDPSDLERPIAMNMLDHDPARPEEKTFIVNEMQAIFNRLFPPETMGPMFEQYMRNALLLLMEDREQPGTLMEVPRVFTDAAWRKAKLARINNPAVLDFWEKEAAKTTGEHSIANMAPYITSKFNNFIANDYVRPIIAQVKSGFRFRNIMDEGKILLVNLSKGRIGELNAGLLGMVIVGKLLMAALSRVDIGQNERRDFYLYIDEFQNFTTDSISVILSEARKYRLNLTLAHQFIGQLTDNIKNAVFGNVGSLAAFRVGATDAEFLVKQFEPVFSLNDLISIDNFNAFVRILVNNETTRPFNVALPLAPEGNKDLAARIRELSRTTYGQPRDEIEADILRRLRE